MAIGDILSIGQSALAAAEIGIATTGNNIANASTPGYSREVVQQTEGFSQGSGSGFVGSGVNVSTVQRQFSSFAAQQTNAAQASSSSLSTWYTQIQQIDNMLGDTTSGLTPTMQSFFSGMQTLSSNPSSLAARQAVLGDAQTMTSQFQSMGSQLDQINQGINTQITDSVGSINTIASQIAQLNQEISVVQNGTPQTGTGQNGTTVVQPANTLLDQRDQLVSQLNQQVAANVVQESNGQYDVYIGNGQPLVLGSQTYALSTSESNLNPSQLAVSYTANGQTQQLPDNSLTGGALGGALSFRNQSLDSAQNSLGLLAIGMGSTLNAQQALGVDLNGNPGQAIFSVGTPEVYSAASNTGTGTLSATISNTNALTGQDYQLSYNSGTYTMTPVTGGTPTTFTSFPQTIGGVTYSMSGTPANGDMFLVRPTANGADSFNTIMTNPVALAAASPVVTSTVSDPTVMTALGTSNTGTGTISSADIGSNTVSPFSAPVTLTYNSGSPATVSGFPAGQPVTVDNNGTTTTYAAGQPVPFDTGATYSVQGVSFVLGGTPNNGDTFTLTTGGTGTISAATVSQGYLAAPLTAPLTLTYNGTANTLSGFPPADAVTVTNNGTSTVFPAGTPVTYTAGATLSFGGMSMTIAGTPVNGDTFTLSPASANSGDGSNAVNMANLQSVKLLMGGLSTYQNVYSQLTSAVASKTSELQVTSTSEGNTLTQMQNAQQAISGVNLNEEATNLLQYQQAYQAAGKLMQVASQLFTTLLSSLGN